MSFNGAFQAETRGICYSLRMDITGRYDFLIATDLPVLPVQYRFE